MMVVVAKACVMATSVLRRVLVLEQWNIYGDLVHGDVSYTSLDVWQMRLQVV